MENNYRTKVITSFLWKILETGGTQGIQFIVQILLARLLSPDQFGTIAVVTVFVNLARVFIENGFSTALVQKKDADDLDFSSVFYLSSIIILFLYILIYIIAPHIAAFYNEPQIVLILRVFSLILFPGAINSIQNAYISKNFLFKRLFVSNLVAVILSGTIGVFMAINGFGVWSLVTQQLANQVIITFILWFTVRWRPIRNFSLSRAKSLFSFGWKLLASSWLFYLYNNLRTLIIGKSYSATKLGYFNRGQQLPLAIVNSLNGSIQSVMLPTLASEQENILRMKSLMRRAIKSSSFIVFPMMIGLAAVAESLVIVILTDTWLPIVPFMQIYCLSYLLIPINTTNLQAINALGRSDLYLKLEIFKKIIGTIIILMSLPFGILMLVYGELINSVISTIINIFPSYKLVGYSYKEQWNDIIPTLINSVIMGIIVYSLNNLNISSIYLLLIQVIVGVFVYFTLARITKNESLSYLINIIKEGF